MTVPLIVFSFFFIMNIAALLFLSRAKIAAKKRFRRSQKIRKALTDAVFKQETDVLLGFAEKYPTESLLIWRDLTSAVTFSPEEERPIRLIFRAAGIEAKLIRQLGNRQRQKRYQAAQLIRSIASAATVIHISKSLHDEKFEFVRLALVKSLIHTGDPDGYDGIAQSLDGCSLQYLTSVKKMLESSDYRFLEWAQKRTDRKEPWFHICILAGAKLHVTSFMEEYIASCLTHDDPRVRSTALDTAQASYPYLLANNPESYSSDIVTYRAAVESITRIKYPLNLEEFRRYIEDPSVHDIAIKGLNSYIRLHPDEIDRLAEYIKILENRKTAMGIASAMTGRLPYFFTMGRRDEAVSTIIEAAIDAGKSAGIIAFLNQNQNPDTENWILSCVAPFLETHRTFRSECSYYLSDRLRIRLGIQTEQREKSVRKIPLTRKDRLVLSLILLLIIGIPAGAIAYSLSSATIGRVSILAREVFRLFTFGFGFYAAFLNIIYIILITLARRSLNTQQMYWEYTDREYLFTPGILPSISILAPAYNEEKTVVQSIHSLLTLEYPDYQVIAVNDGSADATIDVLLDEFELERIDAERTGDISAAPVRAVYRSKKHRNLIVIDKENGGKADALNTGINYADREYICSIDSDSLLEPDSLLRMTARILTTEIETIAVGGNILPVNGCSVARGMLQTIRLPKTSIPRLQTIEYLRSFIAGRLGWSQLNALLIISGAFGLFRRERVLQIGGYMTGRGEFQRDTVGEDMELVVRLIRMMREQKKPYLIQYAASANCWTEVPEDMASLYKQRDRWHRGLVEIMTFHRRMLFNPKYGSAGLVAFPYFVLFEFIGPFYEFAGYPLMIIGFVTGALHPYIFILMFSAILLFGLFISIVSLVLSEKDIVYFHRKELATLLLYSIIENFGFRQLMGWVRVFSFTGMLVKNKGWQKLKRKGFTAA